MADNNVHVKCSDGFQFNLNTQNRKMMDSAFCQQTDKDLSTSTTSQTVDRLKLLYPNVDEKLTPLPRSWSTQEKCVSIGLSENNLRVHYKGFYRQQKTKYIFISFPLRFAPFPTSAFHSHSENFHSNSVSYSTFPWTKKTNESRRKKKFVFHLFGRLTFFAINSSISPVINK